MRKANNELIADFLGYTQPHPDYPNASYWYKENEEPLCLLLFDSDWNWLIKAVEKIYQTDLYYDKYIDYNSYIFSSGEIKLSTNINRVYEQVIDFIKWHNEFNK